jgi:septum formation protein
MLAITLASQSPQRITLLARLGLDVLVQPSGVDETTIAVPADPAEQVRRLAQVKAETVARRTPGRIVLGADTLVAIDGFVLGKPGDTLAATQMLQQLSGRRHTVHTGVALVLPAPDTTNNGWPVWSHRDAVIQSVRRRFPNLRVSDQSTPWSISVVVSAIVSFHHFGEAQIAAYVRTGEPLDKAGGYGIQGSGSQLVAEHSGCFTTVVGLPVCAVALLLRAISGETIHCEANPECRMAGGSHCLCGAGPSLRLRHFAHVGDVAEGANPGESQP